MAQQFYDHFALANMSLQERLGRSATAINRDSAVFGQQTRSLVQMLNYGLDAITARAASHLLNMDVLNSNDAYLLKLTEGLLLNSIESVTPPKINASTPFRFWSEREYSLWSSIGTISLKDGSKTNLIVYSLDRIGRVESSELGTEYKVLYCAGDYVQQTITSGFDGYTPGIFAPIYISETYKSIWSDSVEVTLELDGDTPPIGLELAWSLDELLSMPDNSYAALIQHTPRGMTLTLGDGEVYGKGYNTLSGTSKITSVLVTYVKCDNVAPVDHSTIKFNNDISEMDLSSGIPVLCPMNTGDTADTLRARAISEFFATGKITDARDLVTEVTKVPFVKSCFARQEYNWPLFNTATMLLSGYEHKKSKKDTPQAKFYSRYEFDSSKTYNPGDVVVRNKNLYMCKTPNTTSSPSTSRDWILFVDLEKANAIGAMSSQYFPSACMYDNATIVLSGLVMKSRRYWNEHSTYEPGDVVYHSGTKKLWLAIHRNSGSSVEPGSEDATNVYDASRYWVTRDEAAMLDDGSEDSLYKGMTLKFDEYVPLTQAMFEAEIKGYFNIVGKLGFTSVVVEPLDTVGVTVDVQYTAPTSVQLGVRKVIEDYICYQVGKTLEADKLNSALTEQFNLTSVYVTITLMLGDPITGIEVVLPAATYVPPSMLNVELTERLGRK